MAKLTGNGYNSPRWTHEIVDCSMPMTLDTYNACSYGCLYCFSTYQRDSPACRRNGVLSSARLESVNVEKVRRMFEDPLKYAGQFAPYILQRRVIQWGGLSDQFDSHERSHGVTLELLKFFREIKYPISFSTKATWWLDDDRYRDLFKGSGWHLKVSIVTLDEEKARKLEVGVPTPEERLAAIGKARELIDNVTLRFRPFIIGISNPKHRELIARAAAAGADSVSTEFLCLDQRSIRGVATTYPRMSTLCGFDLYEFYRANSPKQSGYLRLNREIKRPFVNAMHEECDLRGLRFYVSDADFKERCAGGSCCGLPDSMNWSRGQWTYALLVARDRGEVRWADIKGSLFPITSGFLYRLAAGYNQGPAEGIARHHRHTMYDYLHNLWNNPKAKGSPWYYFGGVLRPDRVDDDGDVVYIYDEERL